MAERNGPTDGKRYKRVRKADEAKLAKEQGEKNKGGRPTLFTPEVQAKIIGFIRLGAYIETAARAAGISRPTFQEWMKRGGKGEEPFAGFIAAIEKAMGESEVKDLAHLENAAKNGNWQAAAWRLERRFPKKYGRKLEIAGAPDAPINVSVVKWNGKEVKL